MFRLYECINILKNVRTSVTGDKRTGHPSTSITKGNNEQVRALILDNRRVTIDKVSNQVPISRGCTREIVHRTHFTLVKYVHGEFQNKSRNSKGVTILTFVIAFWISTMTKVTYFRVAVSLWRDLYPTLRNTKQKSECGIKKPHIHYQK
jgi:hypothetical protein